MRIRLFRESEIGSVYLQVHESQQLLQAIHQLYVTVIVIR